MPEGNDLVVGIMALVAKQEREAISRRTKEALAAAKARGVHRGNPNGAAALGRAGNGGAPLRAAVAANADTFASAAGNARHDPSRPASRAAASTDLPPVRWRRLGRHAFHGGG
ncbi:recombinase family protein [Jannaschia formosa]|nr:recombinase family protein [Jannaschia formosa]